jgi:hypothetical protein
MKRLGATVVKVNLQWQWISPRRRPRDPARPANYNWTAYDLAVADIRAKGMRPWITFGHPAVPRWAGRGGRNDHVKPREFELFVRAAGRHFDGSGAPRVDLWSIWNEPNLPNWLKPQRFRGRTPLSPSIYRKLYLAAHRALSRTGHRRDTILMGELFSGGSGPKYRRVRIGPLEFLREMACLDPRYRPYRGSAARARGCGRVRRIPTSGLAYHPYTETQPPWAALYPGDAGISRLGRVTAVLDRIARRGRLPRGLKIWISEFGFQTRPPDPFGRPIRLVPGYMDYSEWTAFRNRRVAGYMQYSLFDELPARRGPLFQRWFSWQAGLRFHGGLPKRGVYAAWQLPAYVRLVRGGVELFGGLKGARIGTPVLVESRTRGAAYTPLLRTTLNARGYFWRRKIRVSRAHLRQYRFTIGGLSRTKVAVRR